MPSNRLADETSPYLRQHAENPVDWYPWGDQAFAEAQRRNVPVLVSVGYSACHWCHVMAHECFEADEVAAVMNDLFVSIKVDREERPDVDSIYMDAVQAMTGRGGWPMTVFCTPDGHPFFGGTYFPKEQFLQLLANVSDVWRTRPDDIRHNVDALTAAIARTSLIEPQIDLPSVDVIDRTITSLDETADVEWGGFGSAPKFPSTMNLDLRLARAATSHQRQLPAHVVTTLDAMASGGMYDHVGGGFARYSTDRQWLVPHFEKMLYDQALIARLYVHAAMVTGELRWRQVATETIEYVLRDLRHPNGGFYSAEDADSLDDAGESKEGWFYTWASDEVAGVVGDDAQAVLDWYGFSEVPLFEGRHIPCRLHRRGDLLRPEHIERARQSMFETRLARPRPGLDDKVITEWNGLMLATLAEAAACFGRTDWAQAAIANGEFLLAELRSPSGRWRRSWHASGRPKARHASLAADDAALIDGFIRLAELTGHRRWIEAAMLTADGLLDHFWDVDRGGVFTTADDGDQLIVRQKDLLDNATPSANSMAAVGLARLAALTGEQRYANHCDQILRLLGLAFDTAPGATSHALLALDLRTAGTVEVAVVGDRPDLVAAMQRSWQPRVVLAWGEPYDSPLWHARSNGYAYVCRDHACQQPVSDVDRLIEQLDTV